MSFRISGENFKRVFKDRLLGIFFVLGLLVNILGWVYIYIKVKPQVGQIPLHYNIYFGIDLIGNWYEMYYLPLSALLIFFINFFFSFIINKQDKILIYYLISGALLVQIIHFLAIYFILL